MLTRHDAVAVGWKRRAHVPGGVAVAALLAAMMGMLALGVVNILTTAYDGVDAWVHGVGTLWMPGAAGIGPYAGKETLSLVVWMAAWVALHYALRRRELRVSTWLIVFVAGVGVATILILPPVFAHIAGLMAPPA